MRLSRGRWGAIATLGLLVLAAGGAHAQSSGIAWQSDYAKAVREAQQAKKPLFVDFYAEWCGACQLMAQTTLRDPQVVSVLRQLVCVRVDVDRQPAVAKQYQVYGIPRVVVLAADQSTALDVEGYVDAETLLAMLKGAAFQLGGVKLPGASGSASASGGVAALIEALGSTQRATRERAAAQLPKLGDRAVGPLLDALTHPHLGVRLGAWQTLKSLLHPPASLAYDPWAATADRNRKAAALRGWARSSGKKQ